MTTIDAVAVAVAACPDDLFVSSLGTATSALRAASDDGPNLYLGGAMGCGLATALGVADRCPSRGVIAVAGDGDGLMGAGSLWSFAGLNPPNLPNLLLLILDDGRYSITGGQELVAPHSFAAVTAALPNLSIEEVDAPNEVAPAVRELPRPAVVVARIEDRSWPGRVRSSSRTSSSAALGTEWALWAEPLGAPGGEKIPTLLGSV